jgi:nucleoid DNA-binding protein
MTIKDISNSIGTDLRKFFEIKNVFVEMIIKQYLNILLAELIKNKKVRIPGFGNLYINKSSQWINPRQKELGLIEKNIITFKTTTNLKDKING